MNAERGCRLDDRSASGWASCSFRSLSLRIQQLWIAICVRTSLTKIKPKPTTTHYTRGITPKSVTNGETHLCGLKLG